MKCTLCKFKTSNEEELKNHYINFHNVDENNEYFKKIMQFQENDVLIGERCPKCNEFIPTLKYRNYHNFLKHYKDGKDFEEEKPISIIEIGNNIKKYEIKYSEHSDFYDFHNAEKLVDEFLKGLAKKIKRSNEYFLIRGGFSIENLQPTLDNYDEPLKNTKYWSTEPIETKSFNEFVHFNIRESILKRIIKNGLTGSSWRFNRFVYVNIKTFSVEESFLKT